jgi:hypothetical protein
MPPEYVVLRAVMPLTAPLLPIEPLDAIPTGTFERRTTYGTFELVIVEPVIVTPEIVPPVILAAPVGVTYTAPSGLIATPSR